MTSFFAPGEEFERILRLFPADRFRRDARGLGDDGFLWEPAPGKLWTATSDASVEGVHYRLDWASPETALRKALLSNLSDVNAMGGRARLALFTLGAPRRWSGETFDALGREIARLEDEFDFKIVGGDTVTVPDSGFFSFTVLGEVGGQPLLRSACLPGQRVYVSGTLGGSAAGLAHLRTAGKVFSEDERTRSMVEAYLSPQPPLELGPALASLRKPVAAIDVSDGLSSELWHLARQSGCALRVEAEKLPAHAGLIGRPFAAIRDFVLNGGEEYQLLFTGDFSAAELAALRAIAPITEIGSAEAGEGVFLTEAGVAAPLPSGGFSHS